MRADGPAPRKANEVYFGVGELAWDIWRFWIAARKWVMAVSSVGDEAREEMEVWSSEGGRERREERGEDESTEVERMGEQVKGGVCEAAVATRRRMKRRGRREGERVGPTMRCGRRKIQLFNSHHASVSLGLGGLAGSGSALPAGCIMQPALPQH